MPTIGQDTREGLFALAARRFGAWVEPWVRLAALRRCLGFGVLVRAMKTPWACPTRLDRRDWLPLRPFDFRNSRLTREPYGLVQAGTSRGRRVLLHLAVQRLERASAVLRKPRFGCPPVVEHHAQGLQRSGLSRGLQRNRPVWNATKMLFGGLGYGRQRAAHAGFKRSVPGTDGAHCRR
jgi:hypothetical protein